VPTVEPLSRHLHPDLDTAKIEREYHAACPSVTHTNTYIYTCRHTYAHTVYIRTYCMYLSMFVAGVSKGCGGEAGGGGGRRTVC
jgi:hypothetical protein